MWRHERSASRAIPMPILPNGAAAIRCLSRTNSKRRPTRRSPAIEAEYDHDPSRSPWSRADGRDDGFDPRPDMSPRPRWCALGAGQVRLQARRTWPRPSAACSAANTMRLWSAARDCGGSFRAVSPRMVLRPASPTSSCCFTRLERPSATGASKKPVKFVEKRVKGLMFDCRICAADESALLFRRPACRAPMNCPKQLRTGPLAGRGCARIRPIALRGRARHALRFVGPRQLVGEGLAQHEAGRRHPRRPETGRPVAAQSPPPGLRATHFGRRRPHRSQPAHGGTPLMSGLAGQPTASTAGPSPRGAIPRGELVRVLRIASCRLSVRRNPRPSRPESSIKAEDV